MTKVSVIDEPRVLARVLLSASGMRRLALADRQMRITDFDRETANTVFADGVVVALSRRRFAGEEALADFIETLRTLREINLHELQHIITVNDKAASEGEAACDVILLQIVR